MSDTPTNLDDHRGMMAQKATELRRLAAGVIADQAALKAKRKELEEQLLAEPAADWHEVADKVRYLLTLFAEASSGDLRREKLIDRVLADLDRLDPPA
jgi:hypothetical protein